MPLCEALELLFQLGCILLTYFKLSLQTGCKETWYPYLLVVPIFFVRLVNFFVQNHSNI